MAIFNKRTTINRDDVSTPKLAPRSIERTIIASAAKIDLSDAAQREVMRNRSNWAMWQREAWGYFDAIGEVKYPFSLIAAVMSRVRLYAAVSTNPAETPTDITTAGSSLPGQGAAQIPSADGSTPNPAPPAATLAPGVAEASAKILNDLALGQGGHGGMLRSAGLNLQVAGEFLLVQVPAALGVPPINGKPGVKARPERWYVRSMDEVFTDPQGNTWLLNDRGQLDGGTPNTNNATLLPKDAYISRIWRQHPRFHEEADSSLRSVLNECDELLLLARASRATIRSRLNAGMLFVPDGLTVAMSELDEVFDPDTNGLVETLDEDGNPDYDQPLPAPPLDTDFEDELLASMTRPVTDEGSASAVVPLLVRGPQELGAYIKQFSFNRSSDPVLDARSDKVLGRLLNGLDVPKDIVTGLSGVRYCADDQTQVLTRDGWKSYDQLVVGEEVLTLNVDTQLSEWQPISAVNTFDVVDEPMLDTDHQVHSSLTTQSHRWPVQLSSNGGKIIWKTTAELDGSEYVMATAQNTDLPTEPKYTDDLVELIAWFYTEGSVLPLTEGKLSRLADPDGWCDFYDAQVARKGSAFGRSGNLYRNGGFLRQSTRDRWSKIMDVDVEEINKYYEPTCLRRNSSIGQSEVANPAECARIRAALTRLFGPESASLSASESGKRVNKNNVDGTPRWRGKRDTNGHVYEFILNDEATKIVTQFCDNPDKVIDRDFIYSLTKSQLELFIKISIWADGNGDLNSKSSFFQKVEERVEVFELACHLAGIALGRGRPTDIKNNFGHICGLWKCTSVKIQHLNSKTNPPKQTSYTGTVWCPTTPNGTWFARRNGTHYFTGNSNAMIIDESLYRAHIEPLVLMVCDGLTASYLHPRLKSMGFKEHEYAHIVVWYDPTEVLTHADRSQAANDGYDRFEISGKAWRRAQGFAESDAPSPEEQLMRIISSRTTLPPDLIEQFMREQFKRFFPDQAAADKPVPASPAVASLIDNAAGLRVVPPPASAAPPSEPPQAGTGQ